MVPKFRCWFKDTGTQAAHMVEWHELREFKALGDLLQYSGENKSFHLMQSTGLKDKNGVDIFEGDVVRFTWDMLSDVNATEKGKKVRISKVFWSDWRASWAVGKKSCNNDLFRYARNGNTVEVIGNIYENPELLEQANEN
ncbi:YopX family protein [Enterococcus gallinarum]|uniref:YopX family protein n=1 Tax=Enterococcus gallinarum TaxID=1353 RepID=UPI0029545B09|nr:YopX family protein [Enterococcus gallinarum]MDV7740869.1 YopX family protein [Enterococcus gallinarum]